MKDRKIELLEAVLQLFERQVSSSYTLSILDETVFYDDSECDGYCLMDDIREEINSEKNNNKNNL